MKKYGRLFIALLWVGIAGMAAIPVTSHAQTPQCVSSPIFANVNTGPAIVSAIFGTGNNDGIINTILGTVSATFYDNIVENTDFKNIVLALMMLYLTIYGAMIMFNMLPTQHGAMTGDIVSRLVKIGIIYAMVSPDPVGTGTSGWAFFYQWVGGFFMGGMNELITQFSQAGVAGGVTPVTLQAGMSVNPGVMGSLVGPIGQVFSAKFMVVIMALPGSGMAGWILAFFLIWALIDFIFMVIGAMGTYVKSVIGLAFLFGIAPIFFLFLLFDKTRQIFFGWLNQVVAFSLTPVMLFAFLAFYCQLISATLTNMLFNVNTPDFCWAHWFSIPGLWDFWWWLPKNPTTQALGGDYLDSKGNSIAPALNVLDILYFLLLCHLGKSFSEFIERLAQDISGGTGPGVIKGGDVSNWFKSNLTGGKNPAMLGAAIGTAATALGLGVSKLKGTGGKTSTTSRAPIGTPAAPGTPGSVLGGGQTHLDTALADGALSTRSRKSTSGGLPPAATEVSSTRATEATRTALGQTHLDTALAAGALGTKGKGLAGLLDAYKSAKTNEERNVAVDNIVRTAITAITDTGMAGPAGKGGTEDQLKQFVSAVEKITGSSEDT